MAQVERNSFGWVGQGFNPGVEHIWRLSGTPYSSVVSATAHSVQLAGIERSIIAKDVRTISLSNGGRAFDVTVRNIGNTNIPGYNVAFSYVTA